MSDNDGSQGDLHETARQQNVILQGLIDVIGNLLAASRELLAHLQGYRPKDEPSGQGAAPDGDGPSERSANKPQQKAVATAPVSDTFMRYRRTSCR